MFRARRRRREWTVGRRAVVVCFGTRDALVLGTIVLTAHSRRTDLTRKFRGLPVSTRPGPTGTTNGLLAPIVSARLFNRISFNFFARLFVSFSVTRVADRSWIEECAEWGGRKFSELPVNGSLTFRRSVVRAGKSFVFFCFMFRPETGSCRTGTSRRPTGHGLRDAILNLRTGVAKYLTRTAT